MLRILSWNLLVRRGAGCHDVARLIRDVAPDLVLMQETTAGLDALPDLLGGRYHRAMAPPRPHAPAMWSPHPVQATQLMLPAATRRDLPVPIRRSVAPRAAQIIRMDGHMEGRTGGLRIANVHLDHGQRANRRQIRHILSACPDIDVIMGDFNAVGPTCPPGFTDLGPRTATHRMYGVLPLRLDRCVARALHCVSCSALPYGPSDHRPILVTLAR
ncbi:endonuclease/exonuclease/phosphatase family protein [Nguyenibacter vanlangensis]|uniref:Endonuclease/exonuclease/phosphatase family protein n=1 Tax=Nguyenibacter vanlangensis TaxID=1216886 RepID=A0A7Y7M5K1_9PROT|nr:endonuclease/exonuclease/phosphatase family protein [Nguyenibacter vanlangensis]NVN11980.1 endonuclease/exonuclease/phosphatase family protein [Nguyenibacter vanlangensis]